MVVAHSRRHDGLAEDESMVWKSAPMNAKVFIAWATGVEGQMTEGVRQGRRDLLPGLVSVTFQPVSVLRPSLS
jgi:hypothetical protein